MTYDLISENPESTVVSCFNEDGDLTVGEDVYQSEAELEYAFIKQLQMQAYEYLTLHTESELIANLRIKLERLNDIRFTEAEWKDFFVHELACETLSIADKSQIIQEDYIRLLVREDGTTKNIRLLDKENIHNNSLQVINQYVPKGGKRENRYDVTVLVNGLPLVHIELKRRGVDIREAFNQINRYQRESFWAGCGLYEYIQIFVISNGTYTKYYSNTTRETHIKENLNGSIKKKQTGNSFEFTSWWADARNRPITDLMDFCKTFFAKHTLLNVLTKYCIFTSERMLMVMRPYQIVATERIIQRIRTASNYKRYGTVEGGGYIWHTTGSGKTLTSFKTARIASQMPDVDKVLFVVDRKDLDYQTMKEYDRFEKGAADSNTNTAVLKKQLESPNCKIIITTIQKLATFIRRNKTHDVYRGHNVIIFDECHRSQFGEMHTAITKAFKNYHIFGFTGTPIFAINAGASKNPDLRTTAQAFGDQLHSYTIIDAIRDKNVLPFRLEYISTMRSKADIEDEDVWDIKRESLLLSPERISNIVAYVLEHFDQKTLRNKYYKLKDKRVRGFNSLFATASIPAAMQYYAEFKKQQEMLPADQRLRIALIYSFGVNEAVEEDFTEDENPETTDGLDACSRDFLDAAIHDYNSMFSVNFDTSAQKFQNYYKDVSKRLKNRDLDMVIVVNMFLTGFDATTLNTLWVDKNLRMHGLLQAYSRTNRILNSMKRYGNIVCFRNLEKATNASLSLFGDKEACGVVLLKSFDDYYYGYDEGKKHIPGYKELVAELKAKFPVGKLIVGEAAEKEFIHLYGAILRVINILTSFDRFESMQLISERQQQDYRSMYLDLYQKYRPNKHDATDVHDDIVFEMNLMKQVEINIDYIIMLVKRFHEEHTVDKVVALKEIESIIDADPQMRKKKDLIEAFIASLTPNGNVDEEWLEFINKKKKEEAEALIAKERLKHDLAIAFINQCLKNGTVPDTGVEIAAILPPMSIFDKGGAIVKKRQVVVDAIRTFVERYRDVSTEEIA